MAQLVGALFHALKVASSIWMFYFFSPSLLFSLSNNKWKHVLRLGLKILCWLHKTVSGNLFEREREGEGQREREIIRILLALKFQWEYVKKIS